nr:Rrf2 family transcriptional regulator [Angustibacter aerolatus]
MTAGVEWAVHCCVAMSRADGPVPSARLADLHGVSRTYLAKHLQSLTRAGIVRSVEGRDGGYQPDPRRRRRHPAGRRAGARGPRASLPVHGDPPVRALGGPARGVHTAVRGGPGDARRRTGLARRAGRHEHRRPRRRVGAHERTRHARGRRPLAAQRRTRALTGRHPDGAASLLAAAPGDRVARWTSRCAAGGCSSASPCRRCWSWSTWWPGG